MSGWELWLTLALAGLGLCCIINAVLLRISMRPPKTREIELLLSGENAECLLRSALSTAHGNPSKITVVCEDDEAEKICEIFSRRYPNIISRHISDNA